MNNLTYTYLNKYLYSTYRDNIIILICIYNIENNTNILISLNLYEKWEKME